MNKKRLSLHLIILSAFLLGIYWFANAQSVQATPSPWVTWKLKTSFPTNTIETTLVVEIGHTSPTGKRVIDKIGHYPVPCQTVGSPVIANGSATFDGTSYFRCTVPSVKEKAALLTNNHLIVPDVCDSERRPYATGVLNIEANPGQLNPSNPLFYLENDNGKEEMFLGTPLDVALQQVTLDAAFNQVEAASDYFALTPSSNQEIRVVFARSGPNSFTPKFGVDGVRLNATPNSVNGPLTFSTLETIAYLGYSPALGDYFEGSLDSFVFDPYCEGKG